MNDVEIPSVTAVLEAERFTNYGFAREEHLKRGSAVHLTCELYDRGTLDFSSIAGSALEGYLEAWIRFCRECGFEPDPELREKPSYDPLWLYAGIPDAPGVARGRDVLVDLKSSEDGHVDAATGLQLAAYERFLPPKKKGWLRWGVGLRPNGRYNLVKFTDPGDQQTFLSGLRSYQWKKARGRV